MLRDPVFKKNETASVGGDALTFREATAVPLLFLTKPLWFALVYKGACLGAVVRPLRPAARLSSFVNPFVAGDTRAGLPRATWAGHWLLVHASSPVFKKRGAREVPSRFAAILHRQQLALFCV